MSASERLTATRRADRPRVHGGDSDTELAIFAATEKLLDEVSLQDLSVAKIIKGAGISRATFYFYFSSKYAVVTGLLARVMDEIYDVMQPFVQREGDVIAEEPLRESLSAAARVWSEHRASLRAVMEHWHAVPELQTLWLDVVNRFASGLAVAIDRERKSGLAEAGLDSHTLGATLIWTTERCFYVAGLGVDDDLPSEQEIVEPLLAIWLGTIYGASAKPAPRSRRRSSPKPPSRSPQRSTARRRRAS
jgi:TetR/AcrR family transcriptional regulator, ethionamide resistance regulator